MSIMTGSQSEMHRPTLKHSLLARSAIAAVVLAALVAPASADEPTVTAVLTSSEAAVGQAVQLQIQVKGDRNVTAPSQISVDGLEIEFAGQQYQSQMNFGFGSGVKNLSSATFTYTIVPQRAGRFTIPPQTLRAGSNSLRTPELTLNVTDSPNQSSGSNRASDAVDPRKSTFAELIVPKTTAYVGEMIPIVVRVGFEIQTRVRNIAPEIDLPGQGFTKQKMRASEGRQVIGGKTYSIVTYKTAISAARTGTIEIGPVEVPAVVLVPQSQRNRSLPQNPLGMSDPFDSFFSDPWLMGSVPREVRLTTQRVNIEVKALPPNAPSSFSGAVGNFTMTADANPKSVQVGDPITVTAKISGRGNFDRVAGPSFEDERGWHKYPPSADFKQDDDVGISGVKTFETVLSPNERKDKIPAQLFTYFDSLKEQYVTLRSDPIPVRVEGGAPPAATLPPVAGTAPAPGASPAAVPKQQHQDILHQLTEVPVAPQSFTPLFARQSFWLVQIFPLLVLVAYAGWKIRRAHLDNREAQRREALQHEATELQRNLRRNDASPQEYFSQASRAVQLKTALAKNLDPNTVDAEIAASAFRADEETRQRLRHLFEKSDEVRYSGSGQNGIRLVPPETRNDVLDLIERLRG